MSRLSNTRALHLFQAPLKELQARAHEARSRHLLGNPMRHDVGFFWIDSRA